MKIFVKRQKTYKAECVQWRLLLKYISSDASLHTTIWLINAFFQKEQSLNGRKLIYNHVITVRVKPLKKASAISSALQSEKKKNPLNVLQSLFTFRVQLLQRCHLVFCLWLWNQKLCHFHCSAQSKAIRKLWLHLKNKHYSFLSNLQWGLPVIWVLLFVQINLGLRGLPVITASYIYNLRVISSWNSLCIAPLTEWNGSWDTGSVKYGPKKPTVVGLQNHNFCQTNFT